MRKKIILILIIVIIFVFSWFVPIIKHAHKVICFRAPCPDIIETETLKQFIFEKI